MDRRAFLYGTIASAVATLSLTAARSGTPRPLPDAVLDAELRGSLTSSSPPAKSGDVGEGSARLQAAIDHAGRSGKPLYLPPGRYVVSGLTLPEHLSIVGVPGETRLVYGGGGVLMAGKGCRRISIDGVMFDGANRGLADEDGGLISLVDVAELDLDRVEILGSAGHGLALARCGGRLSACRVTGARGIGLISSDAAGLAVSDTVISNCGDGGIRLLRWNGGEDGTVVTHCRIGQIRARSGGDAGHGISIEDADGVTLESNDIADCAGDAIRGVRVGRPRLTGNGCRDIAGTAIVLDAPTGGAAISGNVVERAAAGILVRNGDGAPMAISGNVLSRLAGDPEKTSNAGIGIGVETGAALSGNSVDGAEAIGIRLGWGPRLGDVVASANVVRRSAIGIGVSVTSGTGGAVIADNAISAAQRGTICGMSYDKVETFDLVADAGAHPGLVIERNAIA